MPRSSSGTLNVARTLATAMSAKHGDEECRRPDRIPFTAATTGARLSLMVRNGQDVVPDVRAWDRRPGPSDPPYPRRERRRPPSP